MKLDKIKFGMLVSWISRRGNVQLDAGDCSDLDNLIDVPMPDVSTDQVNPSRVDDLLKSISEGRKIDAIKAYRALTGSGLKESKDAICMNWSRQLATV